MINTPTTRLQVGVPFPTDGPRQLVNTLAGLRMVAVGGQLLTVATVHLWLDLALPLVPLLTGIAMLAAFDMIAFCRLASPRPVAPGEAVLHITIDTIALGYLLYLTGGATNPFVSLLVMPITLAAMALRLRDVVVVAVLSAATYLALMQWYLPLPPLHTAAATGDFDLHVLGMAISFVITAATLGFFIARLAAALRLRQAEAEHERERALRDEGILAIATQAAGTAHELNTPLSTMRTLLAELRQAPATDEQLSDDLALLSDQADRCRNILRELVAVGRNQLAGTAESMTLGEFAGQCTSSMSLLRPELLLSSSIEAPLATRPVNIPPGLKHAVINLLNNAGDASLSRGDARIAIETRLGDDAVVFSIRDFGRGLGATTSDITRFATSKIHGLGLGLALANATAERLGGDLTALSPADGGTLQRLRIPLASLDNRER